MNSTTRSHCVLAVIITNIGKSNSQHQVGLVNTKYVTCFPVAFAAFPYVRCCHFYDPYLLLSRAQAGLNKAGRDFFKKWSNGVRLSVLIDTYNHERLIEQAINSVLEQDFPASEREVIVVDDGSTDATAEIVRRFAPQVRLRAISHLFFESGILLTYAPYAQV